jgi:hypothetical protein
MGTKTGPPRGSGGTYFFDIEVTYLMTCQAPHIRGWIVFSSVGLLTVVLEASHHPILTEKVEMERIEGVQCS